MAGSTNHQDNSLRREHAGAAPKRSQWSLLGVGALLLLAVAACSSNAATAGPSAMNSPSAVGPLAVGTGHSASAGDYLTGPTGMTLYIRSLDSAGVSTCTNTTCMTNWPALTVATGQSVTGPAGASGAFGIMTLTDARLAVTYNGWPLYYFSGDSVAGDTTGIGQAAGVWSAAPLNGPMAGLSSVPGTMGSASPMASPSAIASPSAMSSPSASSSASSGY